MRSIALVFCLLCSGAVAQDVIVRGPAVISAQEHAIIIARRGTLVHSSCNQYEGVGCGPTPESARRSCCFFGKRPIVEEGVAYSPSRRQWFAVIRYR
jgi:hypothetical protein